MFYISTDIVKLLQEKLLTLNIVTGKYFVYYLIQKIQIYYFYINWISNWILPRILHNPRRINFRSIDASFILIMRTIETPMQILVNY